MKGYAPMEQFNMKDELDSYDRFSNELTQQLDQTKNAIEILTRSFRFRYPGDGSSIPFVEIEKPVDSFVYCIQCLQHEMDETFLSAIQDLYYCLEEEEKKELEISEKYKKLREEEQNDQ
jgi:hypothetical protein